MPTMDLKFSAAEIAAILADHVERTRPGAKVLRRQDVRFDIEPAYHCADPRERRDMASLRGAVIPVTE